MRYALPTILLSIQITIKEYIKSINKIVFLFNIDRAYN